MKDEQYKKINELLKSSIGNRLNANVVAYINNMMKQEKENTNKLWIDELEHFDIVHLDYSKATMDIITSPKFIERRVNISKN